MPDIIPSDVIWRSLELRQFSGHFPHIHMAKSPPNQLPINICCGFRPLVE